ncbi:MAG: hypothetical protein FJ255_04600 [Phycisphaerae bacterium]|nr:hypothetical protein [Phycisphaerae bacterium]
MIGPSIHPLGGLEGPGFERPDVRPGDVTPFEGVARPPVGAEAPAPAAGPTGDTAEPGGGVAPESLAVVSGAQESLDPRTSLLVAGVVRLPHELDQLARFDPTAAAMLRLASGGRPEPALARAPADPTPIGAPSGPATASLGRGDPADRTPERASEAATPPRTAGQPPVGGGADSAPTPAPRSAPVRQGDTRIERSPGALAGDPRLPPIRGVDSTLAGTLATPRPVAMAEARPPGPTADPIRIGGVAGPLRSLGPAKGGRHAAPVASSVEAQVARGLHAALRQRGGSVTLRLSPESLGGVRIQVKVAERAVTVRIEAQTEAARRLLGDAVPALRSALEDQGLRIERIEVAAPRDAAWNGARDGRGELDPESHGGAGRDAGGREGDSGERGGAWAGHHPAPRDGRSPGANHPGGADPGGGADGEQNTESGGVPEWARLGVDVTA